MTAKTRKMKTGIAVSLCTAAIFMSAPVVAQQSIDEPNLSPWLFGETEKERRDKIRQEREQQREAVEISAEQTRDGQTLDEPRVSPLIFGPSYDDKVDVTGTRVSTGEDDGNVGFFGSFSLLIPDETNLSVGVGPVYEPDYYGSDDYEFNVDPQIYIKFRNFVFLDDDGVDLALFGFSRFRVGPTIKIRGRRDQDDNPALQGLGDVGTTFEFGGFVATTFLDRFATKVKVRHGLKTGHRGTVIDGALTALAFRTKPVSLAVSGRATWVGNRYAEAFYEVSAEQSARSGGRLAVFNADAGFERVGVNATAYINIRERWSLNPYASYDLILDDFANTPIIDEFGNRNQLTVGFHLMREFDLRMK